MIVPTVSRSTEEMLLMVPQNIREAALGLGIPQWRTTISVTLRTARSGIITGIMVAFGHVEGETAPLRVTVFGDKIWTLKVNQPCAAEPTQHHVFDLIPFYAR